MKQVTNICHACGIKHGNEPELSTVHAGYCDVCGKWEVVSEGKDYGVSWIKEKFIGKKEDKHERI